MNHTHARRALLVSTCAALAALGCSGNQQSATGTGPDAGAGGAGGDAGTMAPSDGAAPPGFWDTGDIPAAKNVMTFKFLNRTNGKFADDEVFWSFKSGAISELHS